MKILFLLMALTSCSTIMGLHEEDPQKTSLALAREICMLQHYRCIARVDIIFHADCHSCGWDLHHCNADAYEKYAE